MLLHDLDNSKRMNPHLAAELLNLPGKEERSKCVCSHIEQFLPDSDTQTVHRYKITVFASLAPQMDLMREQLRNERSTPV